MSLREKEAAYDVIVVGGGIAGTCAAIAAVGGGASVAVVQNRSVFGRTTSSEIRMHIMGASYHFSRPDLREIGILREILLENKRRNPYAAFPVFDMILREKVFLEEGITAYPNTNMGDVILDGGWIHGTACHQNSTETQFTLCETLFIDATGRSMLGVIADAASHVGSEVRAEFQEPTASRMANQDTVRNTIMFLAVDRGEPARFEKSVWAHICTEGGLEYRSHVDGVYAQAGDGGMVTPEEGKNQFSEFSSVDAGYRWTELGGDYDDIIERGEEVRNDLLKYVYGVRDHIKSQGDYGVENYDLERVGMVPGYQESRRLGGRYILDENDARANRVFENAVAYGDRPMNVHVPGGIRNLNSYGSKVYNLGGCYTIPYRCYVNRDVDNLMMVDRDISTSKMAFSSTRVVGTCTVGRQAVGTAAALAIRYGCTPKQVGEQHIRELQQELVKNDYYLPGFANEDGTDVARTARVSASSEQDDDRAERMINGVVRNVNRQVNCWKSASLGEPQTLMLKLFEEHEMRQARLTFDTDLGHEIQPSMTENVRDRQMKGLPREPVKDYRVSLFLDENIVDIRGVCGNGQHLDVLDPDGGECDKVQITIESSHGRDYVYTFEVRIY